MNEETSRRPSHAEAAHTLLTSSARGVLATLSRTDASPYASVVELLPTADGDVVVFLSDLAEHTRNFKEDPRVSLLVTEQDAPGEVLALGRATFQGRIEEVEDRDRYREPYLQLHPSAATYIDFDDFSFYRIRVERVRYIGGFGRMSWVERDEWEASEPDPLTEIAPGVLEHMNEDHSHNLLDYSHAFTDADWASEATMVRLDQHGFDMRVADGERNEEVRVPFQAPLATSEEVHEMMVRLARQARETLGK